VPTRAQTSGFFLGEILPFFDKEIFKNLDFFFQSINLNHFLFQKIKLNQIFDVKKMKKNH